MDIWIILTIIVSKNENVLVPKSPNIKKLTTVSAWCDQGSLEVHEIRGRKEVDIMIITVRYTENISDINRKYELLVEN